MKILSHSVSDLFSEERRDKAVDGGGGKVKSGSVCGLVCGWIDG